MKHIKNYQDHEISEGVKWDGKYLTWDDKTTTSIPTEEEWNSEGGMVVGNNIEDNFVVHIKHDNSVYGDAGGYDKVWKTPEEFAKWMSDNDYELIGFE